MKKIFFIAFLFTIGIVGYSQPIVNRSNSSITVQDARLAAQYNLLVPRYADTTAANSGTNEGLDTLGAIIYTYDVQALWVRRYDSGKKWAAIGGGGGGSGTVTSVGWTGGIVSIANPTTTPAFTIAGTSGGIPYFSSSSTWATSAALAANSLVIGGGAGTAPSTTTTGTGILTALGVNIGSAGAPVLFNGAGGTPSSMVGTNITGTASGLSIGGNAATATILQTARNIQGVSFNGSADINPINGTGFVKATGTTLSYDNSTYVTSNIYTADGTLSANRTVTLDSKILNIRQGGNNFISIDPTANAESVFVQAYNTTGFGNYGQLNLLADISQGVSSLSSVFDGGGTSRIYLLSNTTIDSIGYESDRHSFIGEVRLHSLAAGVSTDSVMVWNPTTKRVGYIAPSASPLLPVTGTGAATGTVTGNIGANTLNITGTAGSAINFTAGTYTFNVGAVATLLMNASGSSLISADGVAESQIQVTGITGSNVSFRLSADETAVPDVQIVGDGIAQSITYAAGTHTFTGTVKLGTAGSSTGIFTQSGVTSGTITFQPAAAAGTYTLTWPTTDGGVGEFLQTDGSGVLSWAAVVSGANTALSNLAAVAINTSLISDANNTDDLGSAAIAWKDIYGRTLRLDGSTSGEVTVQSDALGNAPNATTLSGTGYVPATMFSRLTSNFTMSDVNTVQPVFGTSQDVWTLQASTTYYFEGMYYLTHGATSHSVGMSFELAGGASLTSINYTAIAWVTVANTNTASQTTNNITQATNTAINAAGANAQETIRFSGWISVNAGGTVTPSITFSAAPGGAPAAVAGTYITFTPVGSNVVTSLGNVN